MLNPFKRPPDSTFPTIVKGLILGGKIRWENENGEERFDLEAYAPGIYPDGRIERQEALLVDDQWWYITHIQKDSTKGWLHADPFCWHWWDMPGKQIKRVDGSWMPGTERGTYWRSPGWRRQKRDAQGVWILTKGRYFSENWD